MVVVGWGGWWGRVGWGGWSDSKCMWLKCADWLWPLQCTWLRRLGCGRGACKAVKALATGLRGSVMASAAQRVVAAQCRPAEGVASVVCRLHALQHACGGEAAAGIPACLLHSAAPQNTMYEACPPGCMFPPTDPLELVGMCVRACVRTSRWRSASDAALKGGPTIVATQVVSEVRPRPSCPLGRDTMRMHVTLHACTSEAGGRVDGQRPSWRLQDTLSPPCRKTCLFPYPIHEFLYVVLAVVFDAV